MLILWRLVHIFGFVFWFVGLLGTTAAQVAARRAAEPEGRRGAWSVAQRLQPWEILGMVLTPVGGILLAIATWGHLFRGTPPFVHIKLALVIVALILNLLVIAKRKKATALLAAGDDAAFGRALRPITILEGIATLMLPLAVIVVVAMKYGG